MAIKQKKWDEAKVMFEGGKNPQFIADKLGIERSTIAKKAKTLGWEKGKNHKLIVKDVQVIAEKSQLNSQELGFHNAEVEEQVKNLRFIHHATLKNASVMMKKVDEDTSHQEHKFVQETLNKAGEALGVVEKGNSVNINNTNAQQNNADDLQCSVVAALERKHAN